MSNFTRTQISEPGSEPFEIEQIGFEGGYRGDLPFSTIPLEQASFARGVLTRHGALSRQLPYREENTDPPDNPVRGAGYAFKAGSIYRIYRIEVQAIGSSPITYQGRSFAANGELGVPAASWTETPTGSPFALNLDGAASTFDAKVPNANFPVCVVPIPGSIAFGRFGQPRYIPDIDSPVVTALSSEIDRADWLVAFGDRLLALATNGDPEQIHWSDDGNHTAFSSGDAGSLILIDAHRPVNKLMGAAEVGHNSLALFRAFSIMRGYETLTTPALGFLPAISGVGTESPGTIQQTHLGVIFMDAAGTVHILDNNFRLTEVGREIAKEVSHQYPIVGGSARQYSSFVGAYCPHTEEYYLGEIGGSRLWVLDLGEMVRTGRPSWSVRDLGDDLVLTAIIPKVLTSTTDYFTSVGSTGTRETGFVLWATDGSVEEELYFPSANNNTSTFWGSTHPDIWISAGLNRDPHNRTMTLRKVHVKYRTVSDLSTNGTDVSIIGISETGSNSHSVNLPDTGPDKEGIVTVHFDGVTGDNLRFAIQYVAENRIFQQVEFLGWKATLVRRGDYEYS